MTTWSRQVLILTSCVSELLVSLEGANVAPMQRVPRDVAEGTLNTTVRSLETLLRVR